MAYATTLQLSDFMGITGSIPDYTTVGDTRPKEVVGTGDNSNTLFYLDHAYVLAGTYILYKGATESAATALTETTHYTLNKDTSVITLTAAGVTLVGTSNIYAAYNYVSIGFTDTFMALTIARAEKEIDRFTNNHFVDSTVATPDWNQHLDESQSGKGIYQRNYFTLQNYPIPSLSTAVSATVPIVAGDAIINVLSTAGFLSSGYIQIEDDKIQYTGKGATTFTGCTSVSAHAVSMPVMAYVIEISSTESGGTISWDILTEGTEFELDKSTGRIHIYDDGEDFEVLPEYGVANRFRVSYLSGNSSIPADIVKATLMLSARDLMGLAIRKAHATGMNDFKPALVDVDLDELGKILSTWRNEQYARC